MSTPAPATQRHAGRYTRAARADRTRTNRLRHPCASSEVEFQTGTTTTRPDPQASRSPVGASERRAARAGVGTAGVAAGTTTTTRTRRGRPLGHDYCGPLAPLVGDVALDLAPRVVVCEPVDRLAAVGHLHESLGSGRGPELRARHALARLGAAHAGGQRQCGPDLEARGTARHGARLEDVERLPVGGQDLARSDRGHRDGHLLAATGSG